MALPSQPPPKASPRPHAQDIPSFCDVPSLSVRSRAACYQHYMLKLGSSFASHISLSSAKARCHCLPLSHALIPAL